LTSPLRNGRDDLDLLFASFVDKAKKVFFYRFRKWKSRSKRKFKSEIRRFPLVIKILSEEDPASKLFDSEPALDFESKRSLESDPKMVPEPEPELEDDPLPEPESESESEHEQEPEPEPEPESESDSESDPDPIPRTWIRRGRGSGRGRGRGVRNNEIVRREFKPQLVIPPGNTPIIRRTRAYLELKKLENGYELRGVFYKRPPPKCYRCGEFFHIAKNCPMN